MTLQLKPTSITPSQLVERARQFQGAGFALQGHRYGLLSDGFYEGKMDCLRYPLFLLRELGLWPDEWAGTLPLELRRIRFLRGYESLGINDFPAIQEFLNLNFHHVAGDCISTGDLVGFQLRDKPRMASSIHHVAIVDDEQLWHCLPETGVVKHDFDELWNDRAVCAWRLNNFGGTI